MKKVRSLLILLLAALMLTVFVGCDNNKGLDELPPEEETPELPTNGFHKVDTGDLIISKFYLASKTLPEGVTLSINENAKFIALTNRGDAPIDLAVYSIGLRKPANPDYTVVFELPKASLEPGKTLYLLNSYNGSLSNLKELFPNFATLPEYVEGTDITVDTIWTGVKGYYNGETTVELVMNPVLSDRKDDKNHDIYESWDIVDQVVIDGQEQVPAGTAVIRNDDLTWKILDWASADDHKLLDSVKGEVKHDYSWATFKIAVLDKYMDANDKTWPTAGEPEKYYAMSSEDLIAFNEEAKKEGWTASIVGKYKDFQVSKDGIYIVQSTKDDLGKWTMNDYTVATLDAKIQAILAVEPVNFANLNTGSVRYHDIPSDYEATFKADADAKNWTYVSVPYDYSSKTGGTFELKINDSLTILQTNTNWSQVGAKPVPLETKVEDKELAGPFAITEVFMGGYSGKYLAITNISKETVSLSGYSHGLANIDAGELKISAKETKALPAVDVAPGRTVYVLGKDASVFVNNNHMSNMTNVKMIDLNSALAPVDTKNAYWTSVFTISGKPNIFPVLIKDDVIVDSVVFDINDTKSVIGKENSYIRKIDRSTNKSTGWEVYKSKGDQKVCEMINETLVETK